MNKTLINTTLSALLILSIGLLSGYSIGHVQAKKASFPQVLATEDQNQGVATIKLLEYKNGQIRGEIDGQKARIAYSPEQIHDFQPGESFEIPAYSINLGAYYSARDLPEGTNYIASKQGKYYYHVLDAKSLRITPKNRLYFKTEAQAATAGFSPSK